MHIHSDESRVFVAFSGETIDDSAGTQSSRGQTARGCVHRVSPGTSAQWTKRPKCPVIKKLESLRVRNFVSKFDRLFVVDADHGESEVFRSENRHRVLASRNQHTEEVMPQARAKSTDCYRWKKQFTGHSTGGIWRLKFHEQDNKRLNPLVADLKLDKPSCRMPSQNSVKVSPHFCKQRRREDLLPYRRATNGNLSNSWCAGRA